MNEADFDTSDLAHIEYLLKKDLARRMGAIQEDRISGPAGSRNVGNAREYVEKARVLRTVLEQNGRQQYVPLREIHKAGEWVDDEVLETAGIKERDAVEDVVRALHRVSNPHFEPGTMTDHDNVPGRPV